MGGSSSTCQRVTLTTSCHAILQFRREVPPPRVCCTPSQKPRGFRRLSRRVVLACPHRVGLSAAVGNTHHPLKVDLLGGPCRIRSTFKGGCVRTLPVQYTALHSTNERY